MIGSILVGDCIEHQVAQALADLQGRRITASALACILQGVTPVQVAGAIRRLRHRGAPIRANRNCRSGVMTYAWHCLVPGCARTWWYILPGEEKVRASVGPDHKCTSGQAMMAVFTEHGQFPVRLWPFKAETDTMQEATCETHAD